ncbi:MAG: hypothetical protein ACI4O7_05905 [Aristaeellaceae bacterium]
MLACDFFEAAVEAALPGLSALMVNLTAGRGILRLRLAMEDATGALPADRAEARLTAHHAAAACDAQDGTLFLTLRMAKAGDRSCP